MFYLRFVCYVFLFVLMIMLLNFYLSMNVFNVLVFDYKVWCGFFYWYSIKENNVVC